MEEGLEMDSRPGDQCAAGSDSVIEEFKYGQVGRCINGVTHDVNNFLGAILAYAELVSLDPSTAEDSKRMLSDIIEAVRKSSELLSTLTSIARPEKPVTSMVDVVKLVGQTVDLRRYEMRIARIEIEVNSEGEVGLLVVDEPRMIRAMIYLLQNAVEALRESESGKVTVTVRGTADDVAIVVNDTAGPIPESVQALMFDPFHTTKEKGHLGLGLSEARAIVRLHKGDLTYETEKGFCIRLPRDEGIEV